MAIITWRQNPAVIDALAKEAANFDFEQAVTILEQEQNSSVSLGESSDPLNEAVQIKAHVSLANPSAPLHTLDHKSGKKPTLWVNFLGLAGIQGPLPTPYTELLIQRNRQKDFAFRDFLDIFNHRIVSLWYRLRKKFKVSLSPVKPEHHPFGKTLLQLVGISYPEKITEATEDKHLYRILMTYNDILWKRPRSASGLACLLKTYFQVPVTLDLFQGKWRVPPVTDLSFLGSFQGQHNQLGKSMILGKKAWDQSARIHINLGPLSWKMGQAFLPLKHKEKKNYFKTLQDVSKFYVQDTVELRLCLSFKPAEIRPFKLNRQSALGLNSWLGPQEDDGQSYQVTLRL